MIGWIVTGRDGGIYYVTVNGWGIHSSASRIIVNGVSVPPPVDIL